MKELTIKKVRTSSLAGFYAVGFGIVGFVLGALWAMSATIHFGAETQSVLKGLAFGLTAGFLELFFVTVVYAMIGAIVGFVNALIFNLISMSSGGITINVKEEK
ncbi:MAG: hypothetical protein NTV39_02720 [Candidatus Saccharibacteria bacterium]|nr:hypothetical protein [Candidatus Saccharibacteria bacterium]